MVAVSGSIVVVLVAFVLEAAVSVVCSAGVSLYALRLRSVRQQRLHGALWSREPVRHTLGMHQPRAGHLCRPLLD